MDPTLVQTGIAAPLMLGLIVHTMMRRGQTSLRRPLSALLAMILMWILGMAVEGHPDVPAVVQTALLIPPACFMSPLFLILMLRYARPGPPSARHGTESAVLAPFVVFMFGFLTNDWHRTMDFPQMSRGEDAASGGPLFWAFQALSIAAAVWGLAVCVRLALTSASPSTRRCMTSLCAAAALPLATHMASTFGLFGLGFSLTPLALSVTALLVVVAITRFRFLDVQPIARRDVIEASSDGVIVADRDGIVVDVNPAAVELVGRSRADILGSELHRLPAYFAETEPAGLLDSMVQALGSGSKPGRAEFQTQDGRTLEVSSGSPNDADGLPAGHFLVFRDRSTERRTERLLHQSQKLESIGILAAGVAHEVNNPLAFVRANFSHLGAVGALVEEGLEDLPKDLAEQLEGIPEVIEDSVAGLDRIQGVVQGLLRFSRMPTGHRTNLDVNGAVSEAMRFASMGPQVSFRVVSKLAPGIAEVNGVSEQLVQVLLNLLLNARRALEGRDDPEIVATTGEVDGWIEIRVADNGPGVPTPLREQIFDPFFTTGMPNEGTGLGLSIAFDIVSAHGGTLELESPKGGGATFVVRLPAAGTASGTDR